MTIDASAEAERAIPFYVIKSAVDAVEDNHTHAVVRSDNDYRFAEDVDEARRIADGMRSSIDYLSPLNHTVQIVELQETPPEA